MQSSTQKIVTLSPLAIDRVKDFMSKDKDQANGLRIFVAQGGCSGYQYGMVLEKNAKSDDISWNRAFRDFIDAHRAEVRVICKTSVGALVRSVRSSP